MAAKVKRRAKQPSKLDTLLAKADAEKAERLERRKIAKELRKEKRAEHKALHRGTSANRTYTAKIPGATLHIRWHNGNQQVSVDYGGSEVEKETGVEEVVVDLPTVKMTWKKLRAEVVAGNTVYNKSGKSIPCSKRAEDMPNKEVSVTIENMGKTKIYRLV